MKKSTLTTILAVSALGALPSLAAGHAYLTRLRASEFLAEIRTLRPGKSSIKDVQILEEHYRRFMVSSDASCADGRCEIDFNFDNRWLARMHMAPATLFAAGIKTTAENVSEVRMSLDTSPAYFTDVAEVVGEPTSAPYKLTGRRATSGSVQFSLNIELTALAPEEIRRRAYGFNLACLTKVGGCNDARQMLPEVQIPQQ